MPTSPLPTTTKATTRNLTVNVASLDINRGQQPEMEGTEEEHQQQQLQKIESLQQQPDNRMATLKQQHGNDNNGIDNGRQGVVEEEQQEQQQWWNLADYNCNENFECDIMDGLMPYTTYRVRE